MTKKKFKAFKKYTKEILNKLYRIGKAECQLGINNNDGIIPFEAGLEINEEDIKSGYYFE